MKNIAINDCVEILYDYLPTKEAGRVRQVARLWRSMWRDQMMAEKVTFEEIDAMWAAESEDEDVKQEVEEFFRRRHRHERIFGDSDECEDPYDSDGSAYTDDS